jgi:hypothetical protein
MFTRRWSDEQIAAVIVAALDYGHTYAQVAELAAAGDLPGPGAGLEPFPMPRGSVAEYAGAEKRKRADVARAAAAPERVLEEGIGRLARIFAAEIDRIEKEHRAGRLDVRKVTSAAAAGRQVLALQRDLQKPGRKRDRASAEPPAEPDFLDDLAQTAGV